MNLIISYKYYFVCKIKFLWSSSGHNFHINKKHHTRSEFAVSKFLSTGPTQWHPFSYMTLCTMNIIYYNWYTAYVMLKALYQSYMGSLVVETTSLKPMIQVSSPVTYPLLRFSYTYTRFRASALCFLHMSGLSSQNKFGSHDSAESKHHYIYHSIPYSLVEVEEWVKRALQEQVSFGSFFVFFFEKQPTFSKIVNLVGFFFKEGSK